ncbi:helix-turn-helix transcriptional regulator [Intestinibacillus massiliensis]|uniref:helix-turn-helix domain-containing protein n=1 Tax=Intestinibacillus massiliensis TaxID=1871029 RepID=UPI000B34DECB|nr:helix-turn-helix transcriptional regulator [Intestinibacillus massiliensis]MCB6366864.1 helix-turn-helix transcriptional regulator [Intestinibacillus massiliensis]
MSITYDKLFMLLRERGISTYQLRKDKVLGTATVGKMQNRIGDIDTRSIESLCAYLDCQPGDIMEFVKEDLNK